MSTRENFEKLKKLFNDDSIHDYVACASYWGATETD